MGDATSLPVDVLARRCAEETEKYAQREAGDTQFCFELLRRAFGHGSSEAFALMYTIYERRVLAWVYSHTRFTSTGEDAEFFASWAFHTCYRALQGEKFARFPSLAHVLAYLKLCVHTTIAHYLRDQGPTAAVPLDSVAEPAASGDSGAGVEAAELWAHISRLLPVRRDRLLAHCFLVQDLKPRQIIAAYPEQWRDVREVSVAIYRIRQLLRRDPEVCRWAGAPVDPLARERG
jgi:hypothetical protein